MPNDAFMDLAGPQPTNPTGTGGATDPNQGTQQGQFGQPGQQGFQPDPVDPSEAELDSILTAFAPPSGNDTLPGQQQQAAPVDQARLAQDMGNQLRAAIDAAQLPDGILGDSFNPNDPQAMRGALNQVMQHAMAQSVALALRPMQAAMNQLRESMTAQMKAEITAAQTGYATRTKLETLVPEIVDPKIGAILRPMNQHLESQGQSVEVRAKTLKAIIQRMGLKPAPKGGAQQMDDGSTQIVGNDALNAIFGSR